MIPSYSWLIVAAAAGALLPANTPPSGARPSAPPVPPNFLVFVLDDVGTDKLVMYDPAYQVDDGTLDPQPTNFVTEPFCGPQDPAERFPYARTPNLENLARGNFAGSGNPLGGMAGGGIRFNAAYAAPVCNPARACILTGRYAFRTGMGVVGTAPCNSTPPAEPWLKDDEYLLPEMLRQGFSQGGGGFMGGTLFDYRTGAFGKWHLTAGTGTNGCDPGRISDFEHPVDNGWFHRFAGTMENVASRVLPCGAPDGDHWVWTKVKSGTGSTSLQRYEVGIYGDGVNWEFGSCATPGTKTTRPVDQLYAEDLYDASVNRADALAWINAQTQPFFAYVAFNPPHYPLTVPPHSLIGQATEDELNDPGNCQGVKWSKLLYNAMLESVDTEIGRVIQGMSAAKRANTIVFVIGDNGTDHGLLDETPHIDIDPLGQDGKGSMWESGVRVPLIVAGLRVPPGEHSSDEFVHAVDLWRTIRDLSGAIEPANLTLDSISFADLVLDPGLESDDRPEGRDHVFCQWFPFGAYVPTSVGPYAPGTDPLAPDCGAPRIFAKHARTMMQRIAGQRFKLIARKATNGQDAGDTTVPCDADTPPTYTYELYQLDTDPQELQNLYPPPGTQPFVFAHPDHGIAFNQLRAKLTEVSGF